MVLRKRAYTVQALVDAGIPAAVAVTLTASGPRAVPERALVSVTGRKRTKQPATSYCWGPDVNALLAGRTS